MNDSHLNHLQSEAERALQKEMGWIGFQELRQRRVQHLSPGWVALTTNTGGPS